MAITTTRVYWKLGNGDYVNGGALGYNETKKDTDGNVISNVVTRPQGAVEIDEATYLLTLDAVCVAAAAAGVQLVADVAADRATVAANLASAQAKLVAGQPLTQAEAEAIA